jgi:hypothetical protein
LAFSLCVNADPDHLVNIAHPIDVQIHESKYAHKNKFAPIADVEDEGKEKEKKSVDDKENLNFDYKRLMEKAKKRMKGIGQRKRIKWQGEIWRNGNWPPL